jgi:hypothetical protein
MLKLLSIDIELFVNRPRHPNLKFHQQTLDQHPQKPNPDIIAYSSRLDMWIICRKRNYQKTITKR